MRRINRCLNKQLRDICQRAVQMDEMQLKVNHYLPESLRAHCRVGSFHKGCLVVVVATADWATELRYSLPALRDDLRQKAGVYQLISIKIQIAEDPAKTATKPVKPARKAVLSQSAKEALRNAEALCNYEPLKAALRHVSGEQTHASAGIKFASREVE